MHEKDMLSGMREWVDKLNTIQSEAYKIIDKSLKGFPVDVLVDAMKENFVSLNNIIQDLRDTHESHYGNKELAAETRSVLSNIRGIARKINVEIEKYKGKTTDGQLDPEENEAAIRSLISDVQKISAQTTALSKKLDNWLAASSKEGINPFEQEEWKNQLLLLKKKLFEPKQPEKEEKPEESDSDKEMIEKFRAIKYRLLKSTEHFGLVRAPVILLQHYISNKAWDKLKELGYELEWFTGRYTLINNATVMGVSEQMLDVIMSDKTLQAPNIVDAMTVSLLRLNMAMNTRYKNIGNIVKRGYHHYSLLIPYEIEPEDLKVFKWQFK